MDDEVIDLTGESGGVEVKGRSGSERDRGEERTRDIRRVDDRGEDRDRERRGEERDRNREREAETFSRRRRSRSRDKER